MVNVVKDFIDSLNGKYAQRVTLVLKLVEDLECVPVQYFKWVTRMKSDYLTTSKSTE
jgi:hypothetical protein